MEEHSKFSSTSAKNAKDERSKGRDHLFSCYPLPKMCSNTKYEENVEVNFFQPTQQLDNNLGKQWLLFYLLPCTGVPFPMDGLLFWWKKLYTS